MFFLLPLGHDRSVYGFPWATLVLICLNALVFGASLRADAELDERTQVAFEGLLRYAAEHPEARAPVTAVDGLPPPLRERLAPMVSERGTQGVEGRRIAAHLQEIARLAERRPAWRFGYRPAHATALTALTNTFMHAGWLHWIGNMFLLWLAGSVIECFWRVGPYIALYLLAGLVGTLAHHAAFPASDVPLVGASGAVSGVLIAFVLGHPKTRIRFVLGVFLLFRTITRTFEAPAYAAIGIWLLDQLLNAIGGGSTSGVAYWAHIGGAVAGSAGTLLARSLKLIAVDAGTSYAGATTGVDTPPSNAPARSSPRWRRSSDPGSTPAAKPIEVHFTARHVPGSAIGSARTAASSLQRAGMAAAPPSTPAAASRPHPAAAANVGRLDGYLEFENAPVAAPSMSAAAERSEPATATDVARFDGYLELEEDPSGDEPMTIELEGSGWLEPHAHAPDVQGSGAKPGARPPNLSSSDAAFESHTEHQQQPSAHRLRPVDGELAPSTDVPSAKSMLWAPNQAAADRGRTLVVPQARAQPAPAPRQVGRGGTWVVRPDAGVHAPAPEAPENARVRTMLVARPAADDLAVASTERPPIPRATPAPGLGSPAAPARLESAPTPTLDRAQTAPVPAKVPSACAPVTPRPRAAVAPTPPRYCGKHGQPLMEGVCPVCYAESC